MLYFSSRWSKATVLSKMRREKSDLTLHTLIQYIYTLTHTELDVKAIGLVEPFIWSFYGSGPGSLHAQTESQDPFGQNSIQLSFQTNNI